MSKIFVGKQARRKDGLTGWEAKMHMPTILVLLANALAPDADDEARRHGIAALRALNDKQTGRAKLSKADFAARGLDS